MAKTAYSFDTWPIALAIIVASLLFSCAFFFAPSKNQALPSLYPQQHSISVSSEASQEVAPDKVEIVFSVVSRGQDPSSLQAENDVKLRLIKEKLLALGVPAANMGTVGYSLDRWQEYNKTREEVVDMGYQLSSTLRVVSYQTSQAGDIVKEAVQNGANDVRGITFSLSDSAQKEIYGKLLNEATAQARQKAGAMASAAGVSIVSLGSMSESYYYAPVEIANYKDSSIGSGNAPAPDAPISAGLLRVRASVSATYDVEG